MSQQTKFPKPKSNYYTQGIIVFVALLVLTVIEYYVGIWWPSTVLLFLLALAKGALVVNYFMHITKLWSTEEDH
jgi:caa(3)-type oxidase subunit IV